MKILGRAAPIIDSAYGRLHPFQVELIEAIRDPNVSLIRVEAPVGVGKTTAIRRILDCCDVPVVATFPTTILVNTQSINISRGADCFFWPREVKSYHRSYDIFITEYSSQSLFHLAMKNYREIEGKTRGEMLERLFNLAPYVGKKNVILTTPDVLWLLYSGKYKRSDRLQQNLSNAVVIFDEFHCYADLANFYRLLNKLGEGRVSKVVLMSATPFMRDDVVVEFPGELVDISFREEGLVDEETRVFNHQLEVEVIEASYRNPFKLVEILRDSLRGLPRPAAVIFDSIFRLMQVEPLLKKEFADLCFHRYDGMVKDEISLDENSVLLGTSSIEVGVSMDFASLAFEGSSWTSAIQRLGRVGRMRPGQALLISDRSFQPYRPAENEIARGQLEGILKEYLPDPRQDWTSGELFRGDNPNFLLVDPRGRCYVYGPGIFSMYEVLEYEPRVPRDKAGLEEVLRDFRVDEDDIAWLKVRLALFPVAGIVGARRFRERYEAVVSVEKGEDEWMVELANGERFYFEREESDD